MPQQLLSGTKYKNVYLLKPKSFKKLLLDINDHKQRIKFRDYYILLETCIAYYDDYQVKLLNKCIKYLESLNDKKDCKIDTLQEDIKEIKDQNKEIKDQNNLLISMNKDQSAEIKELLNYGKTTNKKLDEIKVELIEVKAQLNDLVSKYYSKQFDYNDKNVLDSKCIKIFEIIKPDDTDYSYFTIMYCSIDNIYDCMYNKMCKHVAKDDYLEFKKFKLVEVFKPSNDSVFIKQNLKTIIKDYCKVINNRKKQKSAYDARSHVIKVVNNKRVDMLKLIKDQFETHFTDNLKSINFNEEEQNQLITFFQDIYVNEISNIVNTVLSKQDVEKDCKMLKKVKTKLLSIQ